MINIGSRNNHKGIISNLEKSLSKEKETYINKQIYSKIEKDNSLLGKEKLICNHIKSLKNKLVKSTGKAAINEILYLYTELYKTNEIVIRTVKNELSNDKDFLKKRIFNKIKNNKLHIEIYDNLLKRAMLLFGVGKKHLKRFNLNNTKSHVHIIHAGVHEKRIKSILDVLKHKDFKKIVNKLLVLKVKEVYNELLGISNKMREKILKDIKLVKNFEKKKSKMLDHEINNLLGKQLGIIDDFAINYSYNFIHSEEFIDSKKNKVILITKRV